jgi:hypothetical protein
MDVDDDTIVQPSNPSAPNAGGPGSSSSAGASGAGDAAKRFGKNIAPMLAAIAPAGYCEMVRARVDQGKPFVTFERAVVIEMKSDSALDKALFERTITDEFRSRFVIAGVSSPVQWQDDAAVRYLAQSLLEQGASYSVSGKYLVLTSSKEFARDILRAATAAPAGSGAATGEARPAGPVQLYAVLHIADSKPVFDKLMAKLDRRSDQSDANGTGSGDASNSDQTNEDQGAGDQSNAGDEKKEVKFFSDNISSLVKALAIRDVRLQRQTTGTLMSEQLNYSWQ